MIPLVAARQTELADLCCRFGVLRLDLFGSGARGEDFVAESDLDFLVEFEPSSTPPALRDFFALRDALSALFGRHIDLVMAGAVRNPFVRADIERSRVAVHGA